MSLEKKDIIIYGAGGLGREILCLIIKRLDEWNPIGFIDDGVCEGEIIKGIPVLPKSFLYQKHENKLAVAIGIADPTIKMKIFTDLQENTDLYFPVLIAPTAIVDESAELDEGCIVSNFCLISINVKLGKCLFVNTKCDIGHDSVIGNFCSLMPCVNVSGNVTVGQRTSIGVQSAILQGVTIGSDVIVGMGSKVIANVSENCTVMGYPARLIDKRTHKNTE